MGTYTIIDPSEIELFLGMDVSVNDPDPADVKDFERFRGSCEKQDTYPVVLRDAECCPVCIATLPVANWLKMLIEKYGEAEGIR